MALEALNVEPQEGISAAFMRNHHGKVCIAFSDPAYVRADTVVIDPKDFSVHVILQEASHFVTQVSDVMARTLAENEEALLTAVKPDGSIFELFAPIQVGQA